VYTVQEKHKKDCVHRVRKRMVLSGIVDTDRS
jgi:hypothetical protein